jgi:hypothetical protein
MTKGEKAWLRRLRRDLTVLMRRTVLAQQDCKGFTRLRVQVRCSKLCRSSLAVKAVSFNVLASPEQLQNMFLKTLPATWVTGLADAVLAAPLGASRGGTVVLNKLASPSTAPAIALVGDAGHATSWRLGYSLQATVDSAAALGGAMRRAASLSEALAAFSAERTEAVAALAKIDRLVRGAGRWPCSACVPGHCMCAQTLRCQHCQMQMAASCMCLNGKRLLVGMQAPVFLGEHAPIGPLRILIQMALAARVFAVRFCRRIGLPGLAPRPSYIAALQAGDSYIEVWKRIRREAALASAIFCSALYGIFRYFWTAYQYNQYLFS